MGDEHIQCLSFQSAERYIRPINVCNWDGTNQSTRKDNTIIKLFIHKHGYRNEYVLYYTNAEQISGNIQGSTGEDVVAYDPGARGTDVQRNFAHRLDLTCGRV